MLIIHRKKREQIKITHSSKDVEYNLEISNYNPLLRTAHILINNEQVTLNMNTDEFVYQIEDMLLILYKVDRGVKLGIKAGQEWKIERL